MARINPSLLLLQSSKISSNVRGCSAMATSMQPNHTLRNTTTTTLPLPLSHCLSLQNPSLSLPLTVPLPLSVPLNPSQCLSHENPSLSRPLLPNSYLPLSLRNALGGEVVESQPRCPRGNREGSSQGGSSSSIGKNGLVRRGRKRRLECNWLA